MGKSTCSVGECDRVAKYLGMCPMHRRRVLATGSAIIPCRTCGHDCTVGNGPKVYCSEPCRPVCKAEECLRKTDGTSTLCKIHRSGVYRYGRLPGYTWAKNKRCLVCQEEHTHPRLRKFCSGKCQAIWHRHGGVAPARFKQCSRCTSFIDLYQVGRAGRKKRADTKMCAACKRAKYTRHRISTTELADRDGVDCGICGETVDMSLVFPDLFRASVDHVVPFAQCGTHDPNNLQLAHLWCNLVKRDRAEFTI